MDEDRTPGGIDGSEGKRPTCRERPDAFAKLQTEGAFGAIMQHYRARSYASVRLCTHPYAFVRIPGGASLETIGQDQDRLLGFSSENRRVGVFFTGSG